MDRQLDVLFVNPNSAKAVYQGLAKDYSCVEPPVWSILLAQSCRRSGYGVAVLDCLAEQLADEQAVEFVKLFDPRLVCFVTYGSEPNAGTKNMGGTVSLAKKLKETYPEYKTCSVGSHTSALPLEVLQEGCFDFVCINEGVYALRALLTTNLKDGIGDVWGIGWVDEAGQPRLNQGGRIVPQERMDYDLPGYAWDLLPLREKPLDRYRSHFWFNFYQHEGRSPYAALYTSTGCFAKCSFCMINVLNRTDTKHGVSAADSPIFRYWSANLIMQEIDKLVEYGVKLIRISDEMFIYQRNHWMPLMARIKEKYGDSVRFWVYARVDTIRKEYLDLLRGAGVRFICLGIESGDQVIRRDVRKGSYQEVNIRQVVQEIHDADIDVIANYIFGLSDDTMESMEKTYQLSEDLNTAMWNAYPCVAIPGSPLYLEAKKSGWVMPEDYSAYSFHSWGCQPCPTKTLSPAEVLKFRDEAFHRYWSRSAFQDMICRKFGPAAVRNIQNMLNIRLKRKLLGDPKPE